MNIMFGNEPIQETCIELERTEVENMKAAIENLPVLNYNCLEDLLLNVYNSDGTENEEFPINVYASEYIEGLEANIVWDTVKLAGKATKFGIKSVRKAHKAGYRQINNLKLNWNQKIKPLLIKILREFQVQLQIMWGKFRKYDKLYVKLGQEINTVMKVYGRQLEQLPSVTLYYHQFNGQMLRGFAEIIASYEAFMGAIKSSPDLFNGNFVEPQQFAEFVKSNDISKAKNAVDNMSAGMQKMNERGDLSIAYAMMNDSTSDNGAWSKIKNFFRGEDNDRLIRVAIKNKTPLVQFVQIVILRNEMQVAYSNKNVDKFKTNFLDRNDSYLPVLATILNRKVLQTVLERGASTIKKETNEDLKTMEEIMSNAQSTLDKKNREAQQNENRMKTDEEKNIDKRQSDAVTGNGNDPLKEEADNREKDTKNMKDGSLSDTPTFYDLFLSEGLEAGNDEFFETKKDMSGADNSSSSNNQSNDNNNNNDPDGTPAELGMAELCAAYAQTYSIFMSKCTAGYSSIVKGVLAATFTLCKEADSIINTIYSAAGANRKDATAGVVNTDNDK